MVSDSSRNHPEIEITAQGRLLKIRSVGLDIDLRLMPKRGRVEGFSNSSRMRLLQMLARIEPPESAGYRFKVSFLTLTTRDFFHPRVVKKYMVDFLKRLGRRFPRMAVVWRLEYQKRGAPHLHLILYNAPYIAKSWVQEAWGEIVGQERPFTRIERVRSYKQLVGYASKYCAKVDATGFNSGAKTTGTEKMSDGEIATAGRVWGVYNRSCLPFAEETTVVLPLDGSWWMIRRYCQKFYPFIPDGYETGFTIFCDDPLHGLLHIAKLQETFALYDALPS